jgi:hypothetical protein
MRWFVVAPLLVALLVPAVAEAESRHLRRARKLMKAVRYPAAEKALAAAASEPLSPTERVQLFEMKAAIRMVFDDRAGARAAFVTLLEEMPDYQPDPSLSPTLLEVLREARAEVAPDETATPDASGKEIDTRPPPEPVDPPEPLVEQWWFWVGLGAVLGGATAATLVLTRRAEPPNADWGPLSL